MDITVLNNLLKTASAGSLTVAARESHLSLQALAAQLKKAEIWFGVPLFHRHHKGVTLTEQGQQLLPYIRQVVQSANQLEHQARQLQIQQSPQIHIALNNTFSVATNQRIIEYLTHKLAGHALVFSASETPENLAKMKSGEADIAIVLGESFPQQYHRIILPDLYISVVAASSSAWSGVAESLICPQQACAYAASYRRFLSGFYPSPAQRPGEIPSGSEQVTLSLLLSRNAVGIISRAQATAHQLRPVAGFSDRINASLLMKNAYLTAADIPDFPAEQLCPPENNRNTAR
ncbi:LysR family transcriptional regulator [Shimwellia blattae]|uniref:Putative transcriptional regulator n=1 Tax=Shimwellia blattae (strain ATCC 29907 / DSM 4481 / JCM 1650 / NBRC 105725 / CDC 9005-74) TaxID=630626 RepID=I2B3S7_SHIBC|nr:LysR family transcriptional regulator [Shimwellia blattae]AFJ45181.1 putative transcriptional regulator [Shimwellia blattae DSM 4481 = NBRC 105725]GAB80703.1 putative LysR family transcriptional regulator [Shimwellia blattae DSM 4481 = NBRC 105725]VDY62662.1 Morphology and auto-aggregation control protein [Shimwellia blattae]VEC19390.1 Morphology and auto-aggregation control protein [Shimwellia blattae]